MKRIQYNGVNQHAVIKSDILAGRSHLLSTHLSAPVKNPNKVCVTNIGSVLKKADHIKGLPAHVVCLSETCLTEQSARVVQRQMVGSGMNALVGNFVSRKDVYEHCSSQYRGANSGCAVFSRIPARLVPIDRTLSSYITGRLMASVCRLGPFDVLIITVYGVPSLKGIRANAEIIRQAADIVAGSSLPSLIVGDYPPCNHRIPPPQAQTPQSQAQAKPNFRHPANASERSS